MLAVPVSSANAASSGPRPIDFSKDTRQVIDLLDRSFGQKRNAQGQRVLYERINVGYANPLSRRLSMAYSSFVPGFVWDENGKIIGNVTLLSTDMPGRHLVANVAVHEEYRRRGVARILMEEAINHIQNQGGKHVLLQVESDNDAAINLYDSMGFVTIGVMNRWTTSHTRLRTSPIPPEQSPLIRKIGGKDWKAAYNLDMACVHPDLNWPIPPTEDYYKSGFWRRINDSLNGRRLETWVTELRSELDQKRRLTGLVSISSEWGRPNWLRLRIIGEWKEHVGPLLLNKGLLHLKKLRGGTINLSYPANDKQMNLLFDNANFRVQRALAVMRLDLT